MAVRPFLQEFLETLSQIYQIYLYTASDKNYADKVLSIIDPQQRFFQKRFYREHCKMTEIEGYTYTKSLARLNVPLHQTVFVDDNSYVA